MLRSTEPFTPSAEDLRKLAEHLFYEVQMAFDLTVVTFATRAHVHGLTYNAEVEALPLHVRQLTDFFWGTRRRTPRHERDAFAADYFAPGEWAKLRPERPALLHEVRTKAGWGIAHLTYGRAHVTQEEKTWQPAAICHALAPVVLSFVGNVDRSQLDPQWFDAIRPCVERFLAAVKPPP